MNAPDSNTHGPIRPGLLALVALLIAVLIGIGVGLRGSRRTGPGVSAAEAPGLPPPPAPRTANAAARSPAAEMGRYAAPVPPASPRAASESTHPPAPVAGTSEVMNPDRFHEPGYSERIGRHIKVRSALESPARHTPEFQGIAAACEKFGYAPWAVSDAYTAAYVRRRSEKAHLKVQQEGGPAPSPEMIQRVEDEFVRDIISALGGPEDPVDPDFIAAVRAFSPEVFIGPNAFSAQPGESMVDTLDWSAWHDRMNADAPR